MLENLFVLLVLGVSGGYIMRRLQRMGQAFKAKESGCNSCASASCTPASTSGETSLPMA